MNYTSKKIFLKLFVPNRQPYNIKDNHVKKTDSLYPLRCRLLLGWLQLAWNSRALTSLGKVYVKTPKELASMKEK